MRFKIIQSAIIFRPKHTRWYTTHLNSILSKEEFERERLVPPPDWYRAAYSRLIRLSFSLQNIEHIDGKFRNIMGCSVITDNQTITQMNSFISLAKSFIIYHPTQIPCLRNSTEIKSVNLNSLTKISELLNISVQKRKIVRITILPQVTQHHIWRETLLEVLKDLKHEICSMKCRSVSFSFSMAEQIVSNCINFLNETTNVSTQDSPSWTKLAPIKKVGKKVVKKVDKFEEKCKWEEVVEMFNDISKCFEEEESMKCHLMKLESMKEGLYQIRDISIERHVSYKEARIQDCLVQKKLTKSLGHSSKCLFTLLIYYLYGSVKDLEVEICGGLSGNGKNQSFCVGKVLSSNDEEMVLNGAKELSRVLGVFKFVWETGNGEREEEKLGFHGHLWCLGFEVEERVFKYRGYEFYLHGIKL
ncbi:hypothetical protein LUZ60_011190 [Juncus effusus]|nr:hypothetical protein LUZ60_011190 [Juncus effusus]